ncbi:MAG: 3-dehydroquinate synthase [Betaproteobacteria bacterium]|jgi:3-dehydroquinate synthase|nr:MAG: 3-dehydroquinate synthase [Betaproteobacteria bacterium]
MQTQTLKVSLDARSYPIVIGSGIIDDSKLIAAHLTSARVVVVTNDTVAPLFLERLESSLREVGVDVLAIKLPDGEQHKTWLTLNSVFDAMLAARCDRTTTMIALGGGVIGDLTGFAAATYQRGIGYIQIPTTLLAQVDSSVGGKTAINHPLGKNMIGAFHQPRLVIADIATLATLPERELAAGLAEVIKYGAIMDAGFFAWLEDSMDRLVACEPEALAYAVEVSCRCKAQIVAADEREAGARALLNFGHTFGHAIETELGYGEWLHGEAVAAGMLLAASLSARQGEISDQDVSRLAALLNRAGLPTKAPAFGAKRYLELMGHDKKVHQGKLRLVLLKAIGQAYLSAEFSEEELTRVLQDIPADD